MGLNNVVKQNKKFLNCLAGCQKYSYANNYIDISLDYIV